IESLREYCNAEIREKDMPTAGSALTVKAYKNVSDAMEYCRDKDLMPYMKIVYKRCAEEGMDPLEVAAAFLRVSLGEIDQQAAEEFHASKKTNKGKSTDKSERKVRNAKSKAEKKDKKEKKAKKPAQKEKKVKKEKKNGKRTKSTDKNRGHDKRGGRTGKR
ncbi:MAG: hypothetical protein PUB87_06430, partial [Eubacteriaceae bacterium]|nr:hypothetical protein [Eubacteriaceae bacterium]